MPYTNGRKKNIALLLGRSKTERVSGRNANSYLIPIWTTQISLLVSGSGLSVTQRMETRFLYWRRRNSQHHTLPPLTTTLCERSRVRVALAFIFCGCQLAFAHQAARPTDLVFPFLSLMPPRLPGNLIVITLSQSTPCDQILHTREPWTRLRHFPGKPTTLTHPHWV